MVMGTVNAATAKVVMVRAHGDDSQRGRGRGKGLRRLFDHGDLHIMVLSLVAKNQAMATKLSKIFKKPQMACMFLTRGLFTQLLTLLEEQGFLESQLLNAIAKVLRLHLKALPI